MLFSKISVELKVRRNVIINNFLNKKINVNLIFIIRSNIWLFH